MTQWVFRGSVALATIMTAPAVYALMTQGIPSKPSDFLQYGPIGAVVLLALAAAVDRQLEARENRRERMDTADKVGSALTKLGVDMQALKAEIQELRRENHATGR